jgi:hypothetical protein
MQIGVMPFLFGDSADAVDEIQRGLKIRKQEGLGKFAILRDLPVRQLPPQLF